MFIPRWILDIYIHLGLYIVYHIFDRRWSDLINDKRKLFCYQHRYHLGIILYYFFYAFMALCPLK